jgi:hypothetical protein
MIGFVSAEVEVRFSFVLPDAKSVTARHKTSPKEIPPSVTRKIDFGCLITRDNAVLLEFGEIPFRTWLDAQKVLASPRLESKRWNYVIYVTSLQLQRS